MPQRREFEKQRVPSAVVGSADPTSERRSFLGASALHCTWPQHMPTSFLGYISGWRRGRRGVATPGLPYFIKADSFDDTEHLPSPLLLQVRR
ncbi:unnamed protein product [Heligmosomoides polygyrus]|uniref:Uncharacterized protein n=1 Tax=Heligmosomoides polygyrus TaxID=6339 RepID=A0A183G8Z6_HELPZ|nr:unnamed protein product [Heligmosomoides polygyrus]